jgi:cytochrome b pre-mRNA-processing protein 3
MILTAFRRLRQDRNIHALYGAIVAQARLPAFYAVYEVPDTVEGRFELIVLHLVLLLSRLAQDAAAASTGQQLFDVFCRDLDHNLREMGISDRAVPRKMRDFGEAFYGRQAAYRAALAAGNDGELEKAFARNIFGVGGVDDRAVRLARYARALIERLATEPEDEVLAGKLAFPSPEALFHA